MGQYFLVSRPVLRKIIAAAELSPRDTVLEIGPGRGVLTRELARRAGRVIAVEKDRQLCQVLTEELARKDVSNANVICGDILKIPNLYSLISRPYTVVANIPYYLTSRLIRQLLEAARPPERMFLMVQREVAERIASRPPKMNLLAISVQAYGKPEILFAVKPEAFSPRPAVASAFIAIRNISRAFFRNHGFENHQFFRIVHAAFQGKRKTIENSLSRNLGVPKGDMVAILMARKLLGKRPQTLGLDDWAGLVQAMAVGNMLK